MTEEAGRFDRKTLKRLIALIRPFFVSEMAWKALAMLALLIGLLMTVNGLNVLMSYIGRDFMTALEQMNSTDFTKQLYFYLLAFAVATPVVVFYRYTEERLALMWRRWFSLRVIRRYFQDRAYYKLSWYGGIDNPDQRIEEDIRSFCSTSLSLFLILSNSIVALFSFMGILWSISAYLTLAAVGYALLGSVIAYFLGRPLISLNFAQLKKEADYRYKLINVRDNSESIAFYRGENKESTRVRQKLKSALNNLLSIINWNRNLNFFITAYNYLKTIIPTVIVAPMFLRGEMPFGNITQAAFAFDHVLNALSIMVLNFGSLSAFAAVITRLGGFWETLETTQEQPASMIAVSQGAHLEFKNLTIFTPKREQLLLKNISLTLNKRSLLISGPSGSGKSSILRAVAGLWSVGRGSIIRPPLEEAIFLPQRPYMILGNLRNQLVYGINREGILDRELFLAIRMMGLEDMFERVGGFNAVLDWPNVLATGEQQRIAFARLFLAKPKFAYLDEATSALDTESEDMIYTLLKEAVKSFVSVGYHTTLAQYHDTTLELKGDGGWTMHEK